MVWKNLKEIKSVSLEDLNEYNSRPDERVLNLFSRNRSDILIYGATGKWMSDMTEMSCRAILETGTSGRKLYLVSRFSRKDEFEYRFKKYAGLFQTIIIDLMNLTPACLETFPVNASWVIYGAGYKFRSTETEREYANKCSLYGKVIPSLIFSHHRNNTDIVVIGSANGVALTSVKKQAKDDAPLVPADTNHYGRSIREKEETVKAVIELNDSPEASRAVILRGGYMTNFTYGGLEAPVRAVRGGRPVNLENLSYFNIISHRDANIYSLLAVQSASNPVTTLNLSGHTASVKEIVKQAEGYFGKRAILTGNPKKRHLLIDGAKIESIYGGQTDSLSSLISGQIHWIESNGFSMNLDHKVGKSL